MKNELLNFDDDAPLISPETQLPEITLKAIITSILLAIILGAANAYLALKVGNTVAASIPAAVISMGIFRLFRKSNILENNLVQTAASAGEGLACATTFILPSLIISKYWAHFNFWQTTMLVMFGGILGVLFSVPLRPVLLNLKGLSFPEGTAIGNVLKASARGTAEMKNLLMGGAAGGFVAICQTGFQVVASYLSLWFRGGNAFWGISLGFDPVLLGAGYIIGITASSAMFVGTILCWVIGVPILTWIYGMPTTGSSYDGVMNLWDQHIRYIGVGTMIVAGLWTMITLLKPMLNGLEIAFSGMRKMRDANAVKVIRTEKDMPIQYVLLGVLLILLLAWILIWHSINSSGLALSGIMIFGLSLISVITVLVFGFLSALICGYLVGLIGSTNTPLSGILIINVLLLSLIIFPLLRSQIDLSVHANQQSAIAMVIFIATMIGCAAVITNENIQDLKAGRMVGATPWKQQLMILIGVIVSAFVIAPVLELLFQAYGMGGVFPHPGMSPAQMLPAPQAGLMAALAQGVIGHNLPWNMLVVGGIIAIGCIIVDEILKPRGYRLPVLAVGLGIYLPPDVITPTVIGGIVSYFAARHLRASIKNKPEEERKTVYRETHERGILLACGLVAGSALMGVILAIPFVIKGNSDVLKLVGDKFMPVANILGVVSTVWLCYWLFRSTTKIKLNK